jgi:hypothetical protein
VKAPDESDKVTTWKTKDGRHIPIRHLKQVHLENIISFLERIGANVQHTVVYFPPDDFDWGWNDDFDWDVTIQRPDPKYVALVAERQRREDERNHRRELRQRRLVQRLARKARGTSKATRP